MYQWKNEGVFQSKKRVYNPLKGRKEAIHTSILQDNYGGAFENEIC